MENGKYGHLMSAEDRDMGTAKGVRVLTNVRAPRHNYQNIDLMTRYHFRRDRLARARANGYESIAQFIIETYRKTKSALRTGEICGMSNTGVLHFLRKNGEPRIYDKSQGSKPRCPAQ